jgi:hypothetical protein
MENKIKNIAKEVAIRVIELEDLNGDTRRPKEQTLYFEEAVEFLEEFSEEFLFQMGYDGYKVDIKAVLSEED